MTRGRKPLPTHLKVVKGTIEKSRQKKNEAKPKNDKILPPKDLSPGALQKWNEIAPLLKENGLLTNVDAFALGLLCDALERYSETQVTTLELILKSPKGYPILNPLLSVNNRAFERTMKLLAEFGMTPASRSRVEVPEVNPKDSWEKF